MAQRSFRGWLLLLALLGIVLDQSSKYVVFRWLYRHPTHYSTSQHAGAYELVPGAFRLLAQFTYETDPTNNPLVTWSSEQLPRVNHGALFGLGGEHTNWANRFFATISVLAALGIVAWSYRRSTASDRLLCCALGLILGGTVGNLYDRVVFGGVRDFLHFYYIEWPVFNIADCCLVCGAFCLLGQALLTPAHATPAPANAAQPSTGIRAPEIAPM
jgi:lipoprotein signal peptidase